MCLHRFLGSYRLNLLLFSLLSITTAHTQVLRPRATRPPFSPSRPWPSSPRAVAFATHTRRPSRSHTPLSPTSVTPVSSPPPTSAPPGGPPRRHHLIPHLTSPRRTVHHRLIFFLVKRAMSIKSQGLPRHNKIAYRHCIECNPKENGYSFYFHDRWHIAMHEWRVFV